MIPLLLEYTIRLQALDQTTALPSAHASVTVPEQSAGSSSRSPQSFFTNLALKVPTFLLHQPDNRLIAK
jgi:hypothetical protein